MIRSTTNGTLKTYRYNLQRSSYTKNKAQETLTSAYFICMENVNVLWEQLTNAYGEQEAPAENAESGKKDQ